ncbi:hypothetical protein XELAEV_18042108mg [Xenopus laevis]|uniref:Uncharacterized protein n=1 Tax=Xenopus laevis TaxID=8355 RepID=A0A974C3J0_XENLA|nr:hypothetical protein XELAEV_18042108mg [Xenopus laevis]
MLNILCGTRNFNNQFAPNLWNSSTVVLVLLLTREDVMADKLHVLFCILSTQQRITNLCILRQNPRKSVCNEPIQYGKPCGSILKEILVRHNNFPIPNEQPLQTIRK